LLSPPDAGDNPAMLISHTITYVKIFMAHVVQPGDMVVDATVGNGIDTVFLSQHVGPQGRVFGFDVQAPALNKARKRLQNKEAPDNVTLIHGGHECMAQRLPAEIHGQVSAVMFNLGYLPGGDGRIITRPDTICAAIDAALCLLKREGVISLVIYTGHPGGPEEAEAIDQHCSALPPDKARVMRCTMYNHPASKTRLLLIKKR